MMFFEQLMLIASLEVIPTDTIYDKFSEVEGSPRTSSFEQIGLEHHLVMNNFGTLGFILLLMPFFYVLQILSSGCGRLCCCKKLSKYLSQRLYYKYLIRIIIESYVIAIIGCLLNLRVLEFSDKVDMWTRINASLTIIILVIYGLFPVYGVVHFCMKFKQLEQTKVKIKFGEFFVGMNIKSRSMVIYWASDLIRRAIIAVVVVFATHVLWLQLVVTIWSSIVIMITAGYTRARLSTFDRKMDIFNEIKLLMVTYHIMMFTPFVPDPETKWRIGYSCSAVIVIGTFINSTMVILAPFRLLKRSCKTKYAKRQAKKSIANKKVMQKKMIVGYKQRRGQNQAKKHQESPQEIFDVTMNKVVPTDLGKDKFITA